MSPVITPLSHVGLPGAGLGLDRIVRDSPAPTPFGASATLAPPEMSTVSQLDALFAMPDIDDFLAQTLLPALSDGSLLLPARFRDALNRAPEQLRRAAELAPQHALRLGRCAGALPEVQALHAQLGEYLSSLYQG